MKTLQHGSKEQEQMRNNKQQGHEKEEDAKFPPFALQSQIKSSFTRIAVVAHYVWVVFPQITVGIVRI